MGSLTRERLKEADRRFKKPAGEWKQIDLATAKSVPPWMTRAFANNWYIVMVYDDAPTTAGPAIQVLVQRVNEAPIINHWSEMQKIKNELFGSEVMAIEYYPKESELIDDHNMYWMWIFPDGVIPTRIIQNEIHKPLR